ncbi:hypothetical protein O3M35_008693 [Rhynocoris fuscipes]|uniref:Uncharacterized protein n=1 Tax=Rhynocoris fuscipes TaxID=488301 RepID=A0AAW1D7X4_9HEMI
METEYLLSCLDSMRKWWEMMNSLQSDLKELRSLQLESPSLSQDSRSVRYETKSSIIGSTLNTSVPSRINFPTENLKSFNNKDSGKSSVNNGILSNGITKKRKILSHQMCAKRQRCEPINFKYLEPEPYPKYPTCIYKALKAGLGIYDLLGLVHIVPAPWDHALKPPYYPPTPLPTMIKFGIIDFD